MGVKRFHDVEVSPYHALSIKTKSNKSLLSSDLRSVATDDSTIARFLLSALF
jgi:pSer/pThr/pTyr-binding forkhead associated (FHA) protein